MYLTPTTDPVLRHLKIQTQDDYLRVAKRAVEKARRHGDPEAEMRPSASPRLAYMNHGRWVIDCECGAGNVCDPEWSQIPCIACGRIHTVVIYPADRDAIEQALDVRDSVRTRNWMPGESVDYLLADNAAHALPEVL